MVIEFEVSYVIAASPVDLLCARFSSEIYSAMTGGVTFIDLSIDGEFSTWERHVYGVPSNLASHHSTFWPSGRSTRRRKRRQDHKLFHPHNGLLLSAITVTGN